jgi:hypothetical protein
MAQMYGQVVNTGSEQVPDQVKSDPYLYRGLYCRACNRVFCPSCSNMQGEVCPGCGGRQLMPAYRPLLMRLSAQIEATQATPRQSDNQAAAPQPKGGGMRRVVGWLLAIFGAIGVLDAIFNPVAFKGELVGPVLTFSLLFLLPGFLLLYFDLRVRRKRRESLAPPA